MDKKYNASEKQNSETQQTNEAQQNTESNSFPEIKPIPYRKKKRRSSAKAPKNLPILLLIGAIASLIAVIVFTTGQQPPPSPLFTQAPSSTNQPLLADSTLSEDVLRKVQSATVRIVGKGTLPDPTKGEETASASVGSGFIYHSDGFVLTNQHVIAGASVIEV